MFSFLGSLFIGLVASLGFFGFFTILIAPTVAEIISQAVRRSTSRRRSPRLFRTAAVAVALGSLPLLAINLAVLISGKGNLFPVIWHAVYTFMVTSTFYYRLSGIRLNR
jgi:hypothetical protein